MNLTAKFLARALFLAVIILAICSPSLLAQSIRLGRVTPEDFIQGTYEKDPEASAVVLYDYGETRFDIDGQAGRFYYNLTRTMRMQIIDERAFSYADHSIRLYDNPSNRETMSGFNAYVHNLEDNRIKTTRLRSRDLLTEKTSDNIKTCKFTFPEVKAGSIIEFTYTVKSFRIFSPRPWQFQYSLPVEYSEFNFIVPEYYNYNFFMQGFEAPVIQDRKSVNRSYIISGASGTQTVVATNIHYHWVMKDLPALRDEPFTTNISNYYSAIFFELASEIFPGSRPQLYVSSWADVDKLLRDSEYFGGFLSGTRQLRNEMSGLANDEASEEEKIASVLSWFHNNIRWNNSTSMSAGSTARQVINRGSGNSAEINLLLVAALREMGLNANPVVSSTRRNGVVLQPFPTINRFNYVVAAVELENKELLLLDATDPMCPLGMLPLRAINYDGRLIGDNFARWVDLHVEAPRNEKYEIHATIMPDGEIEGKMTITASDFAAFSKRSDIKDHADLEEYKETVKKSYSNLEINELNIESVEDLSVPLVKTVGFLAKDDIQMAADFIYFTPLLVEAFKENPFKLEDRKFPVDFQVPIVEEISFVYNLPEGYEIDHLPGSANFNFGRNAQYNFEVQTNGDGQIVINSLLNINKSFFLPADYAGLKEFFNKIVDKQSEQIVLKSSS
ncbi:MAG: DUF3857 domain-containing protein [Bacteroidales bacterium]|nr:DUF3857 domain-containing protein [Bacteroidales bacterium]